MSSLVNLRSVDLNLLVVLDALLTELHVTRAGARIGLSQPAMSSALARLRTMFGDELLVRTVAGMTPTPRALDLIEPLQQLLRRTERLLERDQSFDPAVSTMQFRIRMSDVLEQLLLPRLLAAFRLQAPGIALDIVHLSPQATVAALEADEVAVAVSMDLDHTGSVRSKPLLSDRIVCLLDHRHPAATDMTMEHFLNAPHLKVSMSPTDGRYVDSALSAMGRTRRIAVNVPHWLVAPSLLRGSAMITVISERLASNFACDGLCVRDLPFTSPPFAWSIYWHRRHDSSAAQKWLREQFQAIAQSLDQAALAQDSQPS